MRYLWLLAAFFLAALCTVATHSVAAPSISYVISTFKNGQLIGTRKVNIVELRNAASTLSSAFQNEPPEYEQLLAVAKAMTAQDRCFNLYASRTALASVEAGIFDASANSEEFLKNSIASIEEINSYTQVTCAMR